MFCSGGSTVSFKATQALKGTLQSLNFVDLHMSIPGFPDINGRMQQNSSATNTFQFELPFIAVGSMPAGTTYYFTYVSNALKHHQISTQALTLTQSLLCMCVWCAIAIDTARLTRRPDLRRCVSIAIRRSIALRVVPAVLAPVEAVRSVRPRTEVVYRLRLNRCCSHRICRICRMRRFHRVVCCRVRVRPVQPLPRAAFRARPFHGRIPTHRPVPLTCTNWCLRPAVRFVLTPLFQV